MAHRHLPLWLLLRGQGWGLLLPRRLRRLGRRQDWLLLLWRLVTANLRRLPIRCRGRLRPLRCRHAGSGRAVAVWRIAGAGSRVAVGSGSCWLGGGRLRAACLPLGLWLAVTPGHAAQPLHGGAGAARCGAGSTTRRARLLC